MTHLAATLADLPSPALVLLDELGTGTDPDEGTALAKAALEKLAAAGAFTAASTHFDELKAFALAHPKMRCAAALFDEESLRPLYKLDFDHPGRSYGLAVAARAGVPAPVVARARELLGPEHRALADLLGGLEARIAEAEAEKARLIAEAARQKAETASRHAALERSFAEMRAEYDRLLDEALTQNKSAETKKRVAEGKSSLAAKARDAGLAAAPAPVRDFQPGDRVRDKRFGVEGVVLTATPKKVTVRTGSMKMDSAPGDLVFLDSGPVPTEQPRGFSVSAAPAAKGGKAREINLLGKYVEDGLAELETFIDSALRGGWRQVRVVHGHGTGRLKQAVREWLRKAPGVSGFDAAPPNEGGDGATIVTLDV
jgi:DNA mismatch repair protein MutS2